MIFRYLFLPLRKKLATDFGQRQYLRVDFLYFVEQFLTPGPGGCYGRIIISVKLAFYHPKLEQQPDLQKRQFRCNPISGNGLSYFIAF